MTLSRRALLGSTLLAPAALAAGCMPRSRLVEPEPAATPTGRAVTNVVRAVDVTDGAGVRLHRALGHAALPSLDPFLMLDEFRSEQADDYLAGFPWHPHRGFETVTYMLHGAMEHEDNLGNRGRLVSGSTQWMTAGHGIIHQEMPKQVSGLMHGFQLWVNLPRSHKLMRPRYQDLAPGSIPSVVVQDANVRVIAGELAGTRGPVDGIVTEPRMLDVTLERRGRFAHRLPRGHNAFVFVISGSAAFGREATRASMGELAVFDRDGDELSASAPDGVRFLLLAGRPIGEPIARRGPFVMNTEAELRQAFDDYRSGRLTQL